MKQNMFGTVFANNHQKPLGCEIWNDDTNTAADAAASAATSDETDALPDAASTAVASAATYLDQ